MPATVHTACVVEVKVTARPEVAVAEMLKGDTPKVTLAGVPNEMVCVPEVTVKDCVTGVAAE